MYVCMYVGMYVYACDDMCVVRLCGADIRECAYVYVCMYACMRDFMWRISVRGCV